MGKTVMGIIFLSLIIFLQGYAPLEKRDVVFVAKFALNYRVALSELEKSRVAFQKGKKEECRNFAENAIQALEKSWEKVDEFGGAIDPPQGLPKFPDSFGSGIRAFVLEDEDVISREDSVILVEIQEVHDVFMERMGMVQKKIGSKMGPKNQAGGLGLVFDALAKSLATGGYVRRAFEGYFRYRAKILSTYIAGSRFRKIFWHGKMIRRRDLVPGREIGITCFDDRFIGPNLRLKKGEKYWVVVTPPVGTELIEMLAGVGDSWIKYAEKPEPYGKNGAIREKVENIKKKIMILIKNEKEALRKIQTFLVKVKKGAWGEAGEILKQAFFTLGSSENRVDQVCKESGLCGVLPSFPSSFRKGIIEYMKNHQRVWCKRYPIIRGTVLSIKGYFRPSSKIRGIVGGKMYHVKVKVKCLFSCSRLGRFVEG